MWTALGYPPCASVEPVFADSIPAGLGPDTHGYTSPVCATSIALRSAAHPIVKGTGPAYINLDIIRQEIEARRAEALDAYARGNIARTRRR